jgi:mRNA-degrading endonuclease toxin of MazEF toxin-antitoxin module
VNPPRRDDEVWLVSLDPTQGSEIRKTRPCLVVSPNEANEYLRTVIIAPMTTTARPYPTLVGITFQSRRGQVALDQSGRWTGNVWFASLAPPRQKPRKLSLRC